MTTVQINFFLGASVVRTYVTHKLTTNMQYIDVYLLCCSFIARHLLYRLQLCYSQVHVLIFSWSIDPFLKKNVNFLVLVIFSLNKLVYNLRDKVMKFTTKKKKCNQPNERYGNFRRDPNHKL